MFSEQSVSICLIILLSAVNMGKANSLVLSQFSRDARIINGKISENNGTRHQVSLCLKLSFGKKHICGGSLIASSVVLSAAHCLLSSNGKTMRNASEFIVVMGVLDRSDIKNSRAYEVSRYKVPNTFSVSTYRDDICILFLSENIEKNYLEAQPIAVNWNQQIVYGTMCQVFGWGETEEGKMSDVLRVLDVPLIQRAKCKDSFGRWLQDSMLCAGYMKGGRDACYGDSGGPLVCNGLLTGIVSTGYRCALPKYPGIYTNVALFGDWIRSETGIQG